MTDYFPVFTHTPDNISQKWQLIRKFVEQWNNITIPALDFNEDILEIEDKLKVKLPDSFKNYITLSKQLLSLEMKYPNGEKSNAYSILFRDCFVVEKIKNQDAISLMIQGENDYYWAVKIDDLQFENPPVHGYILDYENPNNDKFDYSEQTHLTITAFTIGHLLSYIHRNSGFGGDFENENLTNLLNSCFTNITTFDGIKIYETKNIIAFYQYNLDYAYLKYDLSVHLWRDFKVHDIPKNIIELSKERNWCYGIFNS